MAGRKASSRRTGPDATGGGRITPKGTKPKGAGPARPAEGSGRYTPPTPSKADQPSPAWVPILMAVLAGLGMLVIVLNYLGFLPGETDNRFLLLGLALITGALITATRYR